MDVAFVFGIVGLFMVFFGTTMMVFKKDFSLAVFSIIAGFCIIFLFVNLRVKQTIRIMTPVSVTISEK